MSILFDHYYIGIAKRYQEDNWFHLVNRKPLHGPRVDTWPKTLCQVDHFTRQTGILRSCSYLHTLLAASTS